MKRLMTLVLYALLGLAVGWTIVRFWAPHFRM